MPEPVGRNIPLSLPRRFICDLIAFARQVPTVPVQRRMRLGDVAAARAALPRRPGWCAVFTKAYGRVAAARPELRRSYLSFPWPRLYEHPHSIASVAVERVWRGESAVLFGHLRAPESQPLPKIDATLTRFKQEPLESVGLFRRIARLNRFPRPLRRLIWWALLNTSGHRRARQMGTFGVSVYSALGSESLHPLSPLTTTLNYGVIGSKGAVTVRLIYDHRVLDGATVARALADLEAVLHDEIVAELRGLTQGAEEAPPGGGAQDWRCA